MMMNTRCLLKAKVPVPRTPARAVTPVVLKRLFSTPRSVVASSKPNAPRTTLNTCAFPKIQARFYATAADEAVTINVPPMGDSVSSGTILKWLKKKGDTVAMDDQICSVETDKVTIDVPTPYGGVITETLANEGDNVSVGAPLFKVQKGASAPAGAAKETPKDAPKSESAPPKADQTKQEPAKQQDAKPAAPKQDTPKPAETKPSPSSLNLVAGDRSENRVKMTRMRQRISERLMDAKNSYAMLTTMQECDMSALTELRNTYKDAFQEKHKAKLGFMSAFIKASTAALIDQPIVNAVIDGDHIVYRNYTDLSVAVAAPRGLVVPVLRDTNKKSFAQLEAELAALALKARNDQLAIEDMSGGTFTISNGGVYGSLFGTPILNPPQSAILGMHAINKRPVVVNDKIEIRPIMYLALTYDHRLIDGREAVTFLKKIKSGIEDPRTLLLDL